MRLARRDFVTQVLEATAIKVPASLGELHRMKRWSLGQLWTGNRDLHYEVWKRARLGVVEIGLHFEADPLTNARLLGAFRAREREIRAKLGPAPILEEWDRGWARIYEAHPLGDERALADYCAERLAAYIRTLEPMLREELPADVPWELPTRRGGARARARRSA